MNSGNWDKIEKYMLANMPASDPVHSSEHIYRVLTAAMDIAVHCEQPYNRNVLLAACLLHDVGRIDQERYPDRTHAQIGSQKAYDFLLSIGWDAVSSKQVSDAILTHSRYSDPQSISLEAQLLFDADKLDTLGYIGMSRLLMHGGAQGTALYLFDDQGQLCTGSKDKKPNFLQEYQAAEHTAQRLYTSHARRIASEKLMHTTEFYNGLIRDISHYHDQLQTIRTTFFD